MSVENTGAPAVEETAVATPEAVEDAATAALEDVAVEDAPDASETPETETEETADETLATSDEEAAAEPEAEVDPLEGLVQRIPTQEEIEKKFNRVPKDARAEIARVAGIAEQAQKTINELGGDFAIDAVKPLAQLVTKASATDEQLGGALTAIITANPAIGMQLAQGITLSMFADEKLINPILTSALGENATLANIQNLLTLEKSGLIDKEFLNGEFSTEYPNSNLYQTQTSKIQELESKVTELTQALSDPSKAQSFAPQHTRLVDEFDSKFRSEVSNVCQPVFERLKWDANSQLAQLVVNTVQTALKGDDRYIQTEQFLRTNGMNEGLVNANLNVLKNMAQAQIIEKVRGVQSDLRSLSEKSRNAVIAEKKQVETKTREATQPVTMPDTDRLTPMERQEKLRQQFKEALQSQKYAEAVNSKV
jgi:hypothetical protein